MVSNKLISTKEELFEKIATYDISILPMVKKAYDYAEKMHNNQYRKSGEPYIVHPLNVAYEVALMHADGETICAALLHDTLEDTKATYQEIAYLFSPTIAYLVDGVTNLNNLDMQTKEAKDMANYRKVIRGFNKDWRIIIIKLADRLHNMRTLEYKSPEKRYYKAKETLVYYAPLAFFLGSHNIKDELEDLSLKYLEPERYAILMNEREEIALKNASMMQEMLAKIQEILNQNDVPSDIIIRIKHVYGIYREIQKGHNFYDIHDLLALKVLVNEVRDCYASLGLIHSLYPPVNEKFKDFIANPKTNHYKALHTTLFTPNERLLQCRIKTYEMDYEDRNGILSYWADQKKKGSLDSFSDLVVNYPFLETIGQMDKIYEDDKEYMEHIRTEVFGETVYIHLKSGQIIQLPKGSTPVDVAYSISKEVGDLAHMAVVNENLVPFNYVLKNNDRVQIITREGLKNPDHENWESYAKTTRARVLIAKDSKRV